MGMKRRKRTRPDERLSFGERWADGFAFGELFAGFKRVSADDLEAVLVKFHAGAALEPTATVADLPEADDPKRLGAVPEVARMRTTPDGEGFVRVLTEAWERLDHLHPKRWTADQVLATAVALQREQPGAALRLLEAVRRFWAELPNSPYHALERERVERFLERVTQELDLA